VDFEDVPQVSYHITETDGTNGPGATWLSSKGLGITGSPIGSVYTTKSSGGAGATGVIVGFSSPNFSEQDQGLSDSEVLTIQFLNESAKTVSVTLASSPSSEPIINNKSSTVVMEAFNDAGVSLGSATKTFTGVTNGVYTPASLGLSVSEAAIKKITLKATVHPYGGVYIEKVDFGASCSLALRPSSPAPVGSMISSLAAILTGIADILSRIQK
jgi:hypothetical protein